MTCGLASLRMIGIAVTLGCLALAAYAVDWRETVEALGQVEPKPLVLAFFCLLGTLCLFALRWRQLIAAENRPPPMRAFNFLMMGYLANAILPARPGDIIRAVLLRQISGISFSIGMASIVLERLFDVLAVCALGVMTSFLAPLPPLLATGLYSLAAAGVALFSVLAVLGWRRDLIGWTVRRYPTIFRHTLARFFAEWLDRFASAISLFNSPARLLASIVFTCLGWATLTATVMILVDAFHLPAPPVAALLVLVAISLGATVPSSPGSIGVYHFMAVLALSVWNVETPLALAFAIASHALAIGMHIMLGLAAAWYEGIGILGLTRIARSDITVTTQRP
jgi:glycosyltransferase 2 family protein